MIKRTPFPYFFLLGGEKNMNLAEWNKSMPKLSKEELLKLFEDEYIDSGYLYSGCIPANAALFTEHREHSE